MVAFEFYPILRSHYNMMSFFNYSEGEKNVFLYIKTKISKINFFTQATFRVTEKK